MGRFKHPLRTLSILAVGAVGVGWFLLCAAALHRWLSVETLATIMAGAGVVLVMLWVADQFSQEN